MLVKQSSCCRARDSEQNGAQVDKFSMSSWRVRSDASLKIGRFLYKKHAIWGRRRSLASKGSLLQQSQWWFLKIITPLDPRNSKNSKRTTFLVSELCFLCSKACVLYFLVKTIVWTGVNGIYYVICPICCNHCIPCLMYSKVICSFLWKCVVC